MKNISKETVYQCPFCHEHTWFTHIHQLEFHLYKQHLRNTLHQIALTTKTIIQKKHGKWLKQS